MVTNNRSDPSIVEWYEKYLDRILAKSESAKQDLEKNWMGQITGIALSLALVGGLGTIVATKLFGSGDQYTLLYLILPAVNTFLFVRFGLLGATFSKARFHAEKLTGEIGKLRNLPADFDVSQIYTTNSYFEWAHQKYSPATMLFLLTIPLVFSLNHALTIYLTYKYLGPAWYFWIILSSYMTICSICYFSYYQGNKNNTPIFEGKGHLFILVVIGIAILATAIMLVGLRHYDPQPGKIGSASTHHSR